MRMTVSEIAAALGVEPCGAVRDDAVEVRGVTWDSRAAKPGDLYVALSGERVDGHDFAQAAIDAGAVAVLAMRELSLDVPVFVVDDTQAALARLSGAWRERMGGTVVGLTGSTGKTTTKGLVRDVLACAGSTVATKANQNNEIGVPNTLLAADADTRFVVVEMGMRGSGQIAELCKDAKPDWGLVTNAGESHIELLGSRLNIAHAKAELFEALPEGGIAFVNAADDYASEMCAHARLAERGVHIVYFCGATRTGELPPVVGADDAAVWASDVSLDDAGCPSFTMNARNMGAVGNPRADGACACALGLRGLHNVSNACSAAAVGIAAGLTLEQCCRALAGAEPESGRQQVLRTERGVTVVDDSYNANPDSMRASLSTFAALACRGRRIAVLGDMLELGDFSRECHERVGTWAAEAGLDVLVCVGELSRYMADAAVRAGMDGAAIRMCADAPAALDIVSGIVEAGDAVLVKASHSIGLELVVKGLVD